MFSMYFKFMIINIMTEAQKSKILNLLKANEFGVIATNSANDAPESAVVAISQTDDLKLIFGTFENSRKYNNILKDNKVSVVVGWDNTKKQTIQIEGSAKLVSESERNLIEDIHCQKNPSSEKYRNNLQQKYFTIEPYLIKYSDFSIHPQEVWEINLH